MLLSHKHKFIFFQTQKTASASIELALTKYCGEQSIITPVVKNLENLKRQLGYRNRQNFVIDAEKEIYFTAHSPAYFVKQRVTETIWNSYYKF